jgi:glycosyltransferase involved in cell wall biosynthesis
MSEPLRILQLLTVRWYNACAEYAINLSAALAERGHRVVVGGFPGSPPIEEARRRGLQVLDVFDFRSGRLDAPVTLHRFRRYVRHSRFDIVNAHRAEDHLFAALALAGDRTTPLLRTRGDVRPPRRNPLNRLLYERWTDAHVLAADFMRQRFYAPFRIAPERLVTIRPGLDVDAFRRDMPARYPSRDRLGLPRSARLFGVVGRLAAAKGHLVALEAFARLAPRCPEAHLVIAGAAEELTPAFLSERSQHLGIDRRVSLLPRVDDVRTLLAALDVGVVASTRSEAISRVALEFQAAGLPVIGSDLNSIPEIVRHGRTGLIVPPGDAPALAGAMERLMTEPRLLERLGEAGPEQVRRHYGKGAMVELTEHLYRRLIGARRR